MMRAMLLLLLLRRGSGGEFQDRLAAALDASLHKYPAVANRTEDAARYLARVLWMRKFSVLVYEGKVVVDRRLLEGDKAAKHAAFVASAAARGPVPNGAYFFSGDSTGRCEADAPDHAVPSPCLVIAKVSGHAMRGVLTPNPYYEDLASWAAVRARVRGAAAARPFRDRKPVAFWRGHLADSWHVVGDPCAAEAGNHARLAAVAAGTDRPDVLDVKCVELAQCQPRDDRARPCPTLPYTAAMARIRDAPALAVGGFVARENYTDYRYLLNLPGSTAGSYSRNLNHLWAAGGVVLLWRAPFVEWYFPALAAGATHAAVGAADVADVVAELERKPWRVRQLLAGAARVDDELVCPACLRDYYVAALRKLRKRFKLAKMLDEPCLAELFFENANCTGLHLVEVTHVHANRVRESRLPGRGCAALAQLARHRCVEKGKDRRVRVRAAEHRAVKAAIFKKRKKES
ncbi:hypothetical protein SO694_00020459 [Aureococcus anophagefferens]|uniref:Glycosyl transferase CAP10 domain-containing protein n=1 Tax=Aureococcus anophagefferens TaxID=44056 RepID=A0ABR1FU88_AURAN